MAALVVTTSLEADSLLVPNASGRFNVPPASVDASVATSTWLSSTRWVANGRSSAAFYAPAADTGRSVGGLHRESSPTARFRSAMPLPEWLRWGGWGEILDPNVPPPVATRTTWPLPQMQVLRCGCHVAASDNSARHVQDGHCPPVHTTGVALFGRSTGTGSPRGPIALSLS